MAEIEADELVVEDDLQLRGEDNANQELAQHVRDLVRLFLDQELQELQQRIRDLELLVGQPTGAVQFVNPPQQDIPWYQPKEV